MRAGKHVWYDKPAGENWEQWQRVVAMARERNRILQMGYMLRYHDGFERIAEWVKSGMLGPVFSIRAHMSTHISSEVRRTLSRHRGGISYDLCGHMLDQIVWLLGRPDKVTSFLRNDSDLEPAIADNTLIVLEYGDSLAFVDIAAMESRPLARRFEVYGTGGSAIILEPFEPGAQVRLCLERKPVESYEEGGAVHPLERRIAAATIRTGTGVLPGLHPGTEAAAAAPGTRAAGPGNPAAGNRSSGRLTAFGRAAPRGGSDRSRSKRRRAWIDSKAGRSSLPGPVPAWAAPLPGLS